MRLLKIAVIAIILMVAFQMVPLAEAQVTWSAPTMITNNGLYTGRPEMAQRDDGTLMLVYSTTNDVIVDLFSKVYSPSTGWSQEYKLTNTAIQDVSPSVAAFRNGTFALVWAAAATGSNQDIRMARSDGTRIWSETTIVGGSADDGLPSVTITPSGDVWAFWVRFNCCRGDIYYKIFTAGAWQGEQLMTTEGGHNLSPSAYAAKDGKIWVTWSKQNNGNDYEIYAKYNNAGTWSSNIRITQASPNDTGPEITQDRDGKLWIFWGREFSMGGQQYQDELYSTYSSDNGATWPSGNQARITSDPVNQEKDDREPAAIQGSDKKLWLAYMSDPEVNGNSIFQIYMVTSTSIIAAQDLGVRSITAGPSMGVPGTVVTVTVDVRNYGDSQQTTTLNLYLKGASETLIGTRTLTLAPGQSSLETFGLSTTGLALGTYTFRATVTAATGETQANQGDNNVIDGRLVLVDRVPQDVDADGDVDLDDLILVFTHLFSGDLRYDVDLDGDVDLDDLVNVYLHQFT